MQELARGSEKQALEPHNRRLSVKPTTPRAPDEPRPPTTLNRLAPPAVDVPIRCVSIDVEEYFQIEAAHRAVGQARWADWPSRVERNMDLLLALFERTGCRATFFFLGSVAMRHPGLARRCVELGHEIASHGSMHDRLHRLTPESMLRGRDRR